MEEGTYMCVSHGGVICALSYHIGLKDLIPNASGVCFKLKGKTPEKIEFVWKQPEISG